jgi:hypothetical protein
VHVEHHDVQAEVLVGSGGAVGQACQVAHRELQAEVLVDSGGAEGQAFQGEHHEVQAEVLVASGRAVGHCFQGEGNGWGHSLRACAVEHLEVQGLQFSSLSGGGQAMAVQVEHHDQQWIRHSEGVDQLGFWRSQSSSSFEDTFFGT